MLTIVRAPGKEFKLREGAVAQLGERRVRNAKVRGSIPLGSTKNHNGLGFIQALANLG
jgi:hypothetical protein